MKWSKRVRRTHRALGAVFLATVVTTLVALALQAPVWLSYLPLPPLALLLFSGLYLYALPYIVNRRGGGPVDLSTARTSGSVVRSSPAWVSRLHRGAAAVFTVTVVATFVAFALPEPIVWVSYLPLLPLVALMLSGLYLMVVRYRHERRNSRSAASDRQSAPLAGGSPGPR
ncbi:hypothetical protein [Nocardia sp. X0981]